MIGKFDMTNKSCTPKSYDIYVDSFAAITLNILKPENQLCFANISYADNPARDYGALFLALLAPSVSKVLTLKDNNPPALTLPSRGIKNTSATVIIGCRSIKDDKDKDENTGLNNLPTETFAAQRKLIIHYGKVDLFSASTGAIISTLGKRIYGVQTSQLSNGTISRIALTASSTAQFVPIALVNLNYAGNKNFNWNLQAGLGINPNGSSTQVEYFVSPVSFSAHNLYLSPGLHIARSERVINGFYVGDAVTSPTFAVPTQWVATYKLGFTISYKPYK